MNEHIVIVTGAAPLPSAVVELVPPAAIVLGVDSGFDHARAAGLRPFGLIGDLDSVSDESQEWAREHATISRHPSDKDETDTELALAFAADMNPAQITMLGGGDRLDHTIAAIGALGATKLTGVPVLDAWWGDQHIDVLHGPGRRTLALEPGSTISLMSLGRPCHKVSISGVRWPLVEAELAPTIGLGISNEVIDPDGVVTVSVSTSVLTIFDCPRRPDASSTESSPRAEETA